jgi:hypothetical protein
MRRGWFLSVFLLVAVTVPTLSRADEWAPVGRVVQAAYGAHGHFIDVTPIVRRFVLPGAEMDVENRTFGFDPLKGETKRLRLVIATPRGQFRRVYQEGDTIRFWGY